MGYEPIVNCRHCGEPLDVFVQHEDRFCSDDCANSVAAPTPWVIPAGEGNECVICAGDDPEYPGKILFVVKPPVGTSDVLPWDALNATAALIVEAVNDHRASLSREAALVEALEGARAGLGAVGKDRVERVVDALNVIDAALDKVSPIPRGETRSKSPAA